jgi:glycosyltransferase involved in cell wall biosynthesis
VSAPVIAVITRTKNRTLLLERAIRSVLSQTRRDWLHVIVNDGGDPAPVDALVARHADAYAGRVQVIHNPASVGMEAASNIGIRASQSHYLTILDDDDSWAHYFLETVIRELETRQRRFSSVRGVICHSMVVRERVEAGRVLFESQKPFNDWMQSAFVDLDRLAQSNTFIPNAFLFEREAALEVGLYDEGLAVLGDWDFNLRFCMRHDIAVLPETLAFYHQRPSAQGADGNSVIVMNDKQVEYRELLKNRWLRRDLSAGGLGLLMAQHDHRLGAASVQKGERKRSRKLSHILRGFGRLVTGRADATAVEIFRVFRFAGFKGLRRALRAIGS